jgi:hypothetical protein
MRLIDGGSAKLRLLLLTRFKCYGLKPHLDVNDMS